MGVLRTSIAIAAYHGSRVSGDALLQGVVTELDWRQGPGSSRRPLVGSGVKLRALLRGGWHIFTGRPDPGPEEAVVNIAARGSVPVPGKAAIALKGSFVW